MRLLKFDLPDVPAHCIGDQPVRRLDTLTVKLDQLRRLQLLESAE